jgi:hypothetical protein
MVVYIKRKRKSVLIDGCHTHMLYDSLDVR